MTVHRTGSSQVVVPRTTASPAHAAATTSTAPKAKDGDTFEVPRARAGQTGPAGSLRVDIAVDDKAQGAYFHKVATPPLAGSTGIRAEGRLPEVMLDPSRFAVDGVIAGDPVAATRRVLEGGSLDDAMGRLNSYKTGPRDRPSVYLGGHAGGQEADVGLSFDRVYDPAGRAVFTDVAGGSDGRDPAHQFVFDGASRSLKNGAGAVVAQGDDAVKRFMIDNKLQPSFAFRPYWRVSPTEGNTTNWTNAPTTPSKNADWATRSNHVGPVPTNAYFYPGEQFAMSVRQQKSGELALTIRGNNDDANVPAFRVGFRAHGFSGGAAEWKRVSSIDQLGNEGQPVQPTSSMALGMAWQKSEVLFGDAQTPKPLSQQAPRQVRGNDLKDSARYNAVFNVDVVGGVEIVSIRP